MSCASQDQNAACVREGSDVSILARVYFQATGNLLQSGQINRIQRTVYVGGIQTDQTDLVIGNVFYDALQIDARWTVDDIGYNLDSPVPGSLLSGGSVARVEIVFYLQDGSVLPIAPYEFQILPIHSLP